MDNTVTNYLITRLYYYIYVHTYIECNRTYGPKLQDVLMSDNGTFFNKPVSGNASFSKYRI